jgi:hypothetical protein
MESVSVGLLNEALCGKHDAGDTGRAARRTRRGAKDAMRDTEGAAQDTRDAVHFPESAIREAGCAAHPRKTCRSSSQPCRAQLAIGHEPRRHQRRHLRGGDVFAHRAAVADPRG